ncbi:MAG: LysR family transcriptional regulator [Sphingobium sp.]|nr:LysR family transcriptional regulator [Sphingobium sp.]
MDTPSLRQLDLFAQMVAAGNLTRCANDMGLPPEQIARDLASLEMRLGYRLFDDLEGAARLTPAGRKTAEAMTLLSQDTADDWGRPAPALPTPPPAPIAAEPPRRTIMLAAPAPVFGHLQDALAAFEAANEDIAIALDLHVQSAADADAALKRGRADIAYFYALEAPEDFPSRYGWSEPVNIYAGRDHRLAQSQSVSRDDLAATPMLAMERDNAMRAVIETALAKGKVRSGPVALESDNMATIMAALREGVGLFAAFGPLARDLGRMVGIQRLALDMPLPAVEIRQAVRPDAAETLAVEALADFLFL